MTTGRPNRKHGTAHLPAAIAISVLLHLVVLGVLGLAGPGLFQYNEAGEVPRLVVHALAGDGTAGADHGAPSGDGIEISQTPAGDSSAPAPDRRTGDEGASNDRKPPDSDSEGSERLERGSAEAAARPPDDEPEAAFAPDAEAVSDTMDEMKEPASLEARREARAHEAPRETREPDRLAAADRERLEDEGLTAPRTADESDQGRARRPAPGASGDDTAAGEPAERSSGAEANDRRAGVTRSELLEALYSELSEAFEYPRAARDRGIEGTVVLSVWVGLDGELKDLKVEEASGSRILDDAAAETVAKLFPRARAQQDVHRVRLRVRYALN